jgi:pilus assembly protein Flp/PilA
MKKLLGQFMREDEGQDLIEYGLLAGIITAAAVASILTLGPKVTTLFGNLVTALTNAGN